MTLLTSAGSTVMAGSLLSSTNPGQEGSPLTAGNNSRLCVSNQQHCQNSCPQDLKQTEEDTCI